MGLDMYLTKRTYIQNWNHQKEKYSVEVRKDGELMKEVKPERVTYVIEQMAYWRKANEIHKWFVDNCQAGIDDCGDHYVEEGKLPELLGLVNDVLEDPTKAKDLLPTQEGFFFGDKEYSEYYFEDLKETKKVLTEILAEENEHGEFYYHSSW